MFASMYKNVKFVTIWVDVSTVLLIIYRLSTFSRPSDGYDKYKLMTLNYEFNSGFCLVSSPTLPSSFNLQWL